MRIIPSVSNYMTAIPFSIDSEVHLCKARDLMYEKGVRHLPVMVKGSLAGILSDRDIRVISTLPGGDVLTAGQLMSPMPYIVSPETPLDEVVLAMAERKIGSAVITGERGKVLGIFTAVDGLRAFGEMLRREEAASALQASCCK